MLIGKCGIGREDKVCELTPAESRLLTQRHPPPYTGPGLLGEVFSKDRHKHALILLNYNHTVVQIQSPTELGQIIAFAREQYSQNC